MADSSASPGADSSASPRPAPAATSPPRHFQGEVPTTPAPLEVDDLESLADQASTIDDRISTYTESLTSSVLDFPEEYGRRYHAYREGSYHFPNDEREINRMDLVHTLIVKTIGNKLFLAPVKPETTNRILDAGTGTGVWAIEVADYFPNAEIFGNDLSPIQPTWVPPNVKFEVDDLESPWVVGKKYDFIFSRYMAASLTDWPRYIGRIYENLTPNGWAEFQDMSLHWGCDDGTLSEDTAALKWKRLFLKACEKLGRDHSPGPKLEKWVKDASFKNVVHKHFMMPIGPWAKDARSKEIGLGNLAQILDGLDAFTLKLFIGVLGWTREEVVVLLSEVRKDLKAGQIHAYINFHVVYGQKVEEEKTEAE